VLVRVAVMAELLPVPSAPPVVTAPIPALVIDVVALPMPSPIALPLTAPA
jgi:hypothetical protein